MSTVGQELLNVPFPEMVKNLGTGIADAQYALDKVSIRIAQMMSGLRVDANGKVTRDPESLIKLEEGGKAYSLLALGFTPTFYQYVDTVIEMKMAISMSKTSELGVSAGFRAGGLFVAASVNASYSQKYQYSAEGSSLMRTKLVTVPAPVILEQKIKDLVAAQEEEEEETT